MKKIKITFIDTAGHGYYSVSKSDFLAVGADPQKISTYSGHTFSRVYLEEDSDATYFFEVLKAKGIEAEIKNSYNERFKITHNYKPELFSYLPTLGDQLDVHGREYIITEMKNKAIFIRDLFTQMVYKITEANPYEYITRVTVTQVQKEYAMNSTLSNSDR